MKPNLNHLKEKVFTLRQLPVTKFMHIVDETGANVMLAGLENDLDPIAVAVTEIPNMVQAIEMLNDMLASEPNSTNYLFVNGILQRLAIKE